MSQRDRARILPRQLSRLDTGVVGREEQVGMETIGEEDLEVTHGHQETTSFTVKTV